MKIFQRVRDRKRGIEGNITHINATHVHVRCDSGGFRWIKREDARIVARNPRPYQRPVTLPPVGPLRDRLHKLAMSNGLSIEAAAEALSGY